MTIKFTPKINNVNLIQLTYALILSVAIAHPARNLIHTHTFSHFFQLLSSGIRYTQTLQDAQKPSTRIQVHTHAHTLMPQDINTQYLRDQ